MSKILEVLKKETLNLHKSVEKVSGVDQIIDYSITKDNYFNILNKNYLAYYVSENAINNYINYGNDISNWIKHDLNDNILYLEKKYILVLDNLNEAIGAKYVVEGSLLGGAFISKHLKDCSNLKDLKSQRFYSKSDKTRINRWLNFKEEIISKTFSHKEEKDIINGAVKTFNVFKNYYSIAL